MGRTIVEDQLGAMRRAGRTGGFTAAPRGRNSPMSLSGITRTVLHVDDDPDFTRLVAHILERKGFEVVSLNDSRQVLGELIRHGHRVVLLDIDMPGIDGIDLLRR